MLFGLITLMHETLGSGKTDGIPSSVLAVLMEAEKRTDE